jgi:hypothetical protein
MRLSLIALLASEDPFLPGDIISIDSRLEYLGFETDMKRTAYVLKPGESEPPESIRNAWRTALGMSEVYAREMLPARIGHDVWAAIAAEARRLGYRVVGPDAGVAPRPTSGRRWAFTVIRWGTTRTTSGRESPRTSLSPTESGFVLRSWKESSFRWNFT